MEQASEWLKTLDRVINALETVQRGVQKSRFETAEDWLAAAVTVETALRELEPAAADGFEPTPSLTTALVRAAREPEVGNPATWQKVADAFTPRIKTAQRAHDRFSEGKGTRLQATRERIQSYRESVPRRNLPGLSAAEVERHFGIGRTALRGWVAQEKVHAWPLMDDAGQPVTVLRNGKPTQNLRYYLAGVTAAEAAKSLRVTPGVVTALGERGQLGRSMILDHETHKPLTDDGQPVWQYFPQHVTTTK